MARSARRAVDPPTSDELGGTHLAVNKEFTEFLFLDLGSIWSPGASRLVYRLK